MKIYRPLPRDEEISIGSKDFIVSKTDKHGNILYVNELFIKVAGYSEAEVLGAPHNILRHPDMPAAIFFLMWQKIKAGENITALVKNLAKDGRYYWVTTDFEIHTDFATQEKSYIAFRRRAARKVINKVEPLYEHMLYVEKRNGIEASLQYLQGYLEERHMTFDEYMDSLVKPKGLFATIFNHMKNSFTSDHFAA